MNLYTLADLKSLAKSGDTLPAECLVRKDFAVIEKAIDAEAYTADFVITTDEVDRQGDRVAVSGWKLDRYLPGNPILAWVHDYSLPPIGRALSITQDAATLRARFLFDEADPFARKIFAKIQTGFLNAVSVGFIPLAWEWAEEPGREYGWNISAAELLEVSVVSVPANASALIDRRSLDAAPVPVAVPESPKPVIVRQSRGFAERFRDVSSLKAPRSAAV